MSFDIEANLPPEVYPLAWLVGTWRGGGRVKYPGIEDSAIVQAVTFSAGQGPCLAYQAMTRLVNPAGQLGQVWHQESGYWRVTPGQTQIDPPFEVEVFVADAAGVLTLYLGHVNGARIDLISDAMVRSALGAEMNAARRLYGLVKGNLLWTWDLAAFGHPLANYLSAELERQTDPQ